MKKYSLILYIKESNKQRLSCTNNYQTYEEAKEDLEKEIDSLGLSLNDASVKETSGESFYASWDDKIILKIV